MRLSRVSSRLRRWRWLVSGQVQGVGFRPFLYCTARGLNLDGFVRNCADGVIIECQGETPALKQFDAELTSNPPPLADVRRIQRQAIDTREEAHGFRIERSQERGSQAAAQADVTVDAATCPDCISEILSPQQRRRGYGLTNCTQCGPRYSIIRRIPYDRENTTMAHFEMCPSCRAEYTDPTDRRFHAQPIACHDCGPTVELVDPAGKPIPGHPIEGARAQLLEGRIVAIKGLGGFHLAVRADDEQAVQRLRRLKRRDFKPFALMAPSMDAARQLVDLSAAAESLMQSPACPIVLAARRPGAKIASGVAPGSDRLGVMLPYTPIQHLLMVALPTLVMTSGNATDEPLAIDNDDALRRLGPICDAILWHDRSIQRGVDDSVFIDVPGDDPLPVRRARGFVPRAIELPKQAASNGICLGGELKNTIAVVRGNTAILSQHLGDLTHPRACEAFVQTIDDLQSLFSVRPAWVAHDLHPMYTSTRIAQKLSAGLHIPRIAIQHHHAHAAAVMAEHGITQPILAVTCDGTGYGTDGTIWGGELLLADLRDVRRLAHLHPLRLPGGDVAARDTARCALSLLHQAYPGEFSDLPIARRLVPDADRRAFLGRMIRDNVACAHSSGAGRYFDGVAALLGLTDFNHFEAQAAMALETAARHGAHEHPDDHQLFNVSGDMREIDLTPLTRQLVTELERGQTVTHLAALFHEQFARAWSAVVIEQSNSLDMRIVGLSGGVFCNVILSQRLTELLEARGLRVLRHRVVPPNDGGLSLGQAAIASALSA